MATKAKRSNGRTKSGAGAGVGTATRKKSAKSSSARKGWSAAEDKTLKTLIKQNTPTRVIGLKLQRSEASVRQHVSRLGLSLRPTNRSPYG